MIYGKKDRSRQYKMDPESLWVWSNPFDPAFVERIKLFPLRTYDPNTRRWELPLSTFSAVVKAFPSINFEGTITTASCLHKFNDLKDYEDYLNSLTLEVDFKPKTPMDNYQIEWFNEMLHRNRVLNADPMGFGKTKEYLDVCEYRKLSIGYKKILFICEAKHKYNMALQIRLHTDSSYIVVDGTEDRRLKQLRDFYYSDAYYLIMGYESCSIHEDQVRALGLNMGFDGVLIDECQKIQNYEVRKQKEGVDNRHLTVRIVSILEYINPELLILGTGTPVSKKADNLYTSFRLTGLEKRSIWSYKKQYCIEDYFGRTIGYKETSDLQEKLSKIMIRRPKDLLHLKEPKYDYMALRMSPAQLKLYTACQLQLRKELEGTKAYSASDLSKLTRLRQITTSPLLVDGKDAGIKEEVLLELIEEVIANEEKAIIYSIYVDEVLRLRDKLKKYNPAVITGRISAKKAQSEAERFQDDSSCRIFIGSLMACKESWHLTEASHIFLLDMSWNVNDNDQAVARAWRRGQDKTVQVHILYIEDTVDEHVMEIHALDSRLIFEVVEGAAARNVDAGIINRILGMEVKIDAS